MEHTLLMGPIIAMLRCSMAQMGQHVVVMPEDVEVKSMFFKNSTNF